MFSLDDYQWLVSPEGSRAWSRVSQAGLLGSIPSTAVPLSSLRSLCSCSETRALLLQEQLRWATGKGRTKVPDPERWFWTAKLFEQASDAWTAAETARDFLHDSPVIDGCTGAGADLIAFLQAGHSAIGVDLDPIAATLCRGNAANHGWNVDVRCDRMESIALNADMQLHLDPDRRAEGARATDPRYLSPDWQWISNALPKCRNASIKMAPGFRATSDWDWNDCGPPHAMRWISLAGGVRQQRWYWNSHRWPTGSRIASAGSRTGVWHHETFDGSEIDARSADLTLHDASEIHGGYLADQDPVLRASELAAPLAARLGLYCVGAPSGYYWSPKPKAHPMLRWFRILDLIGMDEKKMRALARVHTPVHWELKTRGIDLDLDRLQRVLPTRPDGRPSLVFLMTRIGKRQIAVLAERLDQEVGTDEAT